MREEKEKKVEVETHLNVPLEENLNRSVDEVISASGIDAAISALRYVRFLMYSNMEVYILLNIFNLYGFMS